MHIQGFEFSLLPSKRLIQAINWRPLRNEVDKWLLTNVDANLPAPTSLPDPEQHSPMQL